MLVLLTVILPILSAGAQQPTDAIRLNQIGFYPDRSKVAVAVDAPAGPFHVMTPNRADTVYTGTLSEERTDPLAGETTRIADFSALTQPGAYVVVVPGLGTSPPFEVAPAVYEDVARGALKGFYYIRASTELPEAYAGVWARPAGHPDDQVMVHSSAASEARPEGTLIAAPKGWYDAGDYNKYIVNSGITTATLLSLYEDFPTYMQAFEVDIPESNNTLPDVLDEALWNVRWMLAMQDPNDGGVYTKLTTPNFEGMVMPHEARQQRYVIQKSTAAALDFAAVMAQASRILRDFETAVPGLADSTLRAALAAWQWTHRHPDVLYNQRQMNEEHDPDIQTGGYGDRDLSDEFIWAAAELYVTTQADSFYTAVDLYPDDETPLPAWPQVRTLAYYTLARHGIDLPQLTERLTNFADALIADAGETAYQTVMGQNRGDYIWGSSSVAANQGMALIQAYRLTDDPAYLDYALSNLDYLLGRNATGYSFLTGYGDKTPMHIHHRPSEADAVAEPVPGLLSGGPNPGQQDDCDYPSDLPAKSFVDDTCSYASNEIAINWNAPFVYLAAALEALQR